MELGRHELRRCHSARAVTPHWIMRGGAEDLKTQLGAVIAEHLNGWRRADIARITGMAMSSVSQLRQRKLQKFTLDTLVEIAQRLGYDVELRVSRRSVRARSGSDRSDRRSP